MSKNQNDLDITLNVGYFLKKLGLIRKSEVSWCMIQDQFRILKHRSINDLDETNTTITEEEHGN
jgi:hypothetical protein